MDVAMQKNRQNIIQTVNQYGKKMLAFIRGKVSKDEDAEDISSIFKRCGFFYYILYQH